MLHSTPLSLHTKLVIIALYVTLNKDSHFTPCNRAPSQACIKVRLFWYMIIFVVQGCAILGTLKNLRRKFLKTNCGEIYGELEIDKVVVNMQVLILNILKSFKRTYFCV